MFRKTCSLHHQALCILAILALAFTAPREAAAQRERHGGGGERNAAREQYQNQRAGQNRGGEGGGERGGGGTRGGGGQRGGGGPGGGPGGGAPPQPTPYIGKPYLLPIASTPTSSSMNFVIPAVEMTKPIGIGSTTPESATFITGHLHPGDLTLVTPPEGGGSLGPVTSTTRCIILRAADFDQAAPIIQWAKANSVGEIAFNAEGATVEEIIARQRKLCDAVHREGLSFTFAPKITDLESHAKEIAPYADKIVLQSQRYQGSVDYAETVRGLIAQIKDANPKVKVWVQVSVNPPYAPKIAGQRVVEQVVAIAEKADGVFIFYSPLRWDMTMRVLEALRPVNKFAEDQAKRDETKTEENKDENKDQNKAETEVKTEAKTEEKREEIRKTAVPGKAKGKGKGKAEGKGKGKAKAEKKAKGEPEEAKSE